MTVIVGWQYKYINLICYGPPNKIEPSNLNIEPSTKKCPLKSLLSVIVVATFRLVVHALCVYVLARCQNIILTLIKSKVERRRRVRSSSSGRRIRHTECIIWECPLGSQWCSRLIITQKSVPKVTVQSYPPVGVNCQSWERPKAKRIWVTSCLSIKMVSEGWLYSPECFTSRQNIPKTYGWKPSLP